MADLLNILAHLQFWHWLCLAVILGIVEILAPGIFFIWLAAAALVVGLIVLALSPGWETQILLFAILAVLSLFLWHRIGRPKSDPQFTLNRRGEQMIGRTVTLIEPIQNGRGAARLNDSVWRVEGMDMPVGTQVRITGIDGTVLKVERIG